VRRALLIAISAVVLFAGQDVGELLVRAVGGTNGAKPYTALAYADPEQAVRGLQVGKPVTFVVKNHTGRTRSYEWSVLIKGEVSKSGSVVVEQAGEAGVTVTLERAGELSFEVRGLPQQLSGRVTSPTIDGGRE